MMGEHQRGDAKTGHVTRPVRICRSSFGRPSAMFLLVFFQTLP